MPVIAQPQVTLTPVITTGLSAPMQLLNAGDGTGRVFIVQKGGAIRVYDSTFAYLSDFLTVTGISSTGERGLLSMAFHPDYATNGLFYVYYTNASGDLELARYQVSTGNANVADAASKVIVLTIPHPTNANHNGGMLHFGSDGYLYLSTGDGGGSGDVPNNAQNTGVLLGKILRFNVNTSATAPYYTIPPGNPFANEVYAYGLRNPYRWSFDRLTGDMWIGDVGQDSWEEINYRPAAATASVNYGWRCYEGNATYNTTGCGPSTNYTFPVHTYASQDPAASITGGIVYRGTASPLLQGWYLSADFYSGIFYLVAPNGAGGWNVSTQTLSPTGIVHFGETENGEAYAVSNTGNGVYRISSNVALPVSLLSFTAAPATGGVQLQWQTASETNTWSFQPEYSLDAHSFQSLESVAAKKGNGTNQYTYLHEIKDDGPLFYRLKTLEANGNYTYSGIVQVSFQESEAIAVYPTIVNDGKLHIDFKGNNPYQSMKLLGMDGKLRYSQSLSPSQTGDQLVDISRCTPGLYVLKLYGASENLTRRIVVQ